MNVAPLGPIAGAYYLDNSRVSIIEGPVGSGKSSASCLRLQRHAYEQVPGTNGIAQTRWAIVRNTRKQLEDTTLVTWLQLFPESEYGQMVGLNHLWRFTPQGFTYPIEAEFLFRALDREDDVADLLSLEVTGFWFNEIREMVRAVIAQAGRRTRYLSGDRPSTYRGIIGDTNPWDTDHWLQTDLVDTPRPGWRHFRQPGGMEPDAENLENLSQTDETLQLPYDDPRRREQGRTYYVEALQDYTDEEAHVYVHGQRGRTRSGKPIYTEYRDNTHCAPFELVRGLPLLIGLDFGRTPAAVIAQRLANENWRVRYELCAEDMGVFAFGQALRQFLHEHCELFTIGKVTGDPAGDQRDGKDDTAFDLLKASKIHAVPAPTNEFSVRLDAVQQAFKRMADGKPGLIIHPDCKRLRRACIDGYHYRKMKLAGEFYSAEPNKNQWSHVAEALQYLLLGGGEGRKLLLGGRKPGEIEVESDYSPLLNA